MSEPGGGEAAAAPTPPAYARLLPGDRAPRFSQRCQGLQEFFLDSFAGRYLVVCFYLSAADAMGRGAVEAMLRHRSRFDDDRASFFGISIDPRDESEGRVRDRVPGVRFMWDFDWRAARLFGAAPAGESRTGERSVLRRFWAIIDPTYHLLACLPFSQAGDGHEAVFSLLAALPEPERFAGMEIPAPVLLLPNVFEPGLCRQLVEAYLAHGGEETGVYRSEGSVLDGFFKRRRDVSLQSPELRALTRELIFRKVAPEIERLFFMKITEMERYNVACYAAEDGGHFLPHRDNGPGLSAHRRFAVSVNLNGDYRGGDLVFPEYSRRPHKAPPGWAVVFPCAILHMVTRVSEGRRYAFLPFVYDEAGARIRAANAPSPAGEA